MFEDEKTTRIFIVCMTAGVAVIAICVAAVNIHRDAVDPGRHGIDGTYEVTATRK